MSTKLCQVKTDSDVPPVPPCIFTAPLTCSASSGSVIPTPTLPWSVILNASVPATVDELACSPDESFNVPLLFTKNLKSLGAVIDVSPPAPELAFDLKVNCALSLAPEPAS